MLRIGMMMRSPKMKAMAPPKLMPPRHSTAATGTLPTEQTKLSSATSGPISAPQISVSPPWPLMNSLDQTSGELRGEELPAKKEEQHQAQLEDEVGRCELEDDRVRQGGAFAKQRSCDCHGSVGAGRRRCTESRCEGRGAGIVVSQRSRNH